MHLTSPYLAGPNHVQLNFNTKMQDVKRFLNLNKIATRRRIKQFNFFNWFSNVQNLVLSNCSNMCEMWSNGIKIAFFSKKLQKIAQQLGALPPDPHSLRPLGAPPPDPPSVICLSYTGFLKTSPKLHICTFQLY